MLKKPIVPHAIQRAKEHFGLDFTIRDLKNIEELIANDRTVLSAKCRSGVERHLVNYAGHILPVVINLQTLRVLTILPKCRSKPPTHRKRVPRGRAHRYDLDEDLEYNS